jgi:hypothetical protein
MTHRGKVTRMSEPFPAGASSGQEFFEQSGAPPGPESVRQTIGPLRMIFGGELLCLFDVTFKSTTDGVGFAFDLLNDAVGAFLIVTGVSRLAVFPVRDRRYGGVMAFVRVVSMLVFVDALLRHLIVPWPEVVDVAFTLVGLVGVAATVAFCVAMRWLCEHAGLPAAARSWQVTTALFAVLHVVPLGFVHLAGIARPITGRSFHANPGLGLVVPLLAVMAIPIIHLLTSTSRMRAAAEATWPSPSNGDGSREAISGPTR